MRHQKPARPTPRITVEAYTAKRAWIRNQDIPPGQPAPGHIACPCGKAPESEFNAEQPDIVCPCGTVYTWDGWIISEPEPVCARCQHVRACHNRQGGGCSANRLCDCVGFVAEAAAGQGAAVVAKAA